MVHCWFSWLVGCYPAAVIGGVYLGFLSWLGYWPGRRLGQCSCSCGLGSHDGSSCPHVCLGRASVVTLLNGLSGVDHRMSLSLASVGRLTVYDACCFVVALSDVAVEVVKGVIYFLEAFVLAQVVHGLVLTFSLFLDLPLAFHLRLLLGLLFLLALEFSLPFSLELFQLFALFLFIFLLVASNHLGTDVVFDVRGPVFKFDIVFAVFALVRFASADVHVRLPLYEVDTLIAKLALLRFHGAFLLVVSVLEDHGLEAAVFAGLFLVHLFFVLFLLCFGNALAAILALVILTRAANVVHSELGHLNVFVADGAPFRFNWAVGLLHVYENFLV